MTSRAYSQVPFPSWEEVKDLAKNTALDFPKWTSVGDLACYDLEGAKSLKRYQAECSGAKEKLLLIAPLINKYSDSIQTYEEAISVLRGSLEETRDSLQVQIKVADQAESLRAEAEYWSLTGNMLPWVVTAVSLSFFGGYILSSQAR